MKYHLKKRPDERPARPPSKDLGLSPSRVALCVLGLVPALRLAGLNLTACGILCRCQSRPRTIGALARWLQLSPAAVSLCVGDLEKAALVARAPAGGDKRRVWVKLAPAAGRLWKQLNEDVREAARRSLEEEEAKS